MRAHSDAGPAGSPRASTRVTARIPARFVSKAQVSHQPEQHAAKLLVGAQCQQQCRCRTKPGGKHDTGQQQTGGCPAHPSRGDRENDQGCRAWRRRMRRASTNRLDRPKQDREQVRRRRRRRTFPECRVRPADFAAAPASARPQSRAGRQPRKLSAHAAAADRPIRASANLLRTLRPQGASHAVGDADVRTTRKTSARTSRHCRKCEHQ